ncbi:MAG: hypothetical protein K2K70_13265 [Lachnospiraceae bacterium]|nr:hypothetical protein [Lachnospiraceae bacterium]
MKKGIVADISYNDTMWAVFYFMNALYSLGRVMVKYNYSSVSDSNPISVALHGGIYIVCAVVVFKLCKTFKAARCSMMEAVYFGLKVFYFCWQFSENFAYLFTARAICIAAGAFMSCTLFRAEYKTMDKEYNSRLAITIPAMTVSLIVFIAVYHKYVLLMLWGAAISVFCIKVFGAMDQGAGASSGSYVSIGSREEDDGCENTNSADDTDGQPEMINFSEYDFTRGNIAEDINRIKF